MKKAKELDDNSQTKSDKKDALTIVRLVKDERYSEERLPILKKTGAVPKIITPTATITFLLLPMVR